MDGDDERRPLPFVKPPRLSPLPPVAAGEGPGWQNLSHPESLSHVSLGDITDTLAAAGMEVRIQCRPKM